MGKQQLPLHVAQRLEEGLPKQASVPWLQCIIGVLSHRRQPQRSYNWDLWVTWIVGGREPSVKRVVWGKPAVSLFLPSSPPPASAATVTDPPWGLPGLWALLAPKPPAQLLQRRPCLSSRPTAAGPEEPPSSRPRAGVPPTPVQPAKDGSQGCRALNLIHSAQGVPGPAWA